MQVFGTRDSRCATAFLREHSILSHCQHRFHRSYSTLTQLVTTTHEFSKMLDEVARWKDVFLDYYKTFDKVQHNKLISKLSDVGAPPNIIRWIQVYLSSCRQFVDVDGTQSDLLEAKSGVSQGSALGPSLFLLYVNYLPDFVC